MNDYISRRAALDAIHAWSPKEPWDKFDKQVAFAIIHNLPAADICEDRRGECVFCSFYEDREDE